MSGVYINMEMPKGCAFCKISRRNGKKMVCPLCFERGEWDIRDPMSADHRLDDCPLVSVPDHGRLVDKDTVCTECRRVAEEYDGIYPDCTYCPIHIAPTIIPANFAEDINVPTKTADKEAGK